MRKQLSIGILSIIAALLSVTAAQADYSNTVMSLSPVAYWPLNETVQPPAPYLAANSGTLGAQGNGYYSTYFDNPGPGVAFALSLWPTNVPVSGATSDGDTAVNFTGNPYTYIQIPHTFAGSVIKAPFSIECWVNPTNLAANSLESVVSAGGLEEPLNNSGSWAGFDLGLTNGQWLFTTFNTNGSNPSSQVFAGATGVGDWDYLVATFDGTNVNLYVNGTLISSEVASNNAAGLAYIPDNVNPIQIGMLNPENSDTAFQGAVDELAIYTNVLSQSTITSHFQAASNGGYTSAITSAKPPIYLRLDDPSYSVPTNFTVFPTAYSYGSIGSAANGSYQPGTLPGVTGPTGTGFGSANYAVAFNGLDAGVDVGAGNLAANAPGLNVTGNNPLSVVVWFKGNPADSYNRFQTLLGQGDSGWRIGIGGAGPQFNPGGGGELASSDIFNDGNWHMAVGVYDGGENYIYIDGKLVFSVPYSGSQSGSSDDVLIGGAPDYTFAPGDKPNRYWSGSLAQVAFYTTAISASDIAQLYNAAGMAPQITRQPVSATVSVGQAYTSGDVIAGSSLVYQWYQNDSPLAGQTNVSLAFNPMQATNAGSYFIIATNISGAVTSSVINLTINTNLQITSQPGTNGLILFSGVTHVFPLTASGSLPIYYYWNSNGVTVAASTNSNYTLTNVTASANYFCLVSNSFASVTSSIVSVSVIPSPSDAYPQAVMADGPVAYWRLDETGSGFPNDGVTAYDSWGGYNGTYTNTDLSEMGYPATPTDPDTAAGFGIEDYNGSFMQAPNIDFSVPSGGNAEFSLEAWVNGDDANQLSDGSGIITKGIGGGGEQFDLDIGAGNNGGFRFLVRDTSQNVYIASSGVTLGGNWHHLVAVCDQANGNMYLYVDGVLSAQSGIKTGAGLESASVPMSIGSRQSGNNSGVYDDQFDGIVDEVAVYSYPLSAAQVAAHYNAASNPSPIIQQEPTNATVVSGDRATFDVIASGAGSVAYQWYDVSSGSPGVLLTGATGSTLSLDSVSLSDSGKQYAVVITNLYGSVTSSPALLTVLTQSPGISADLQPLSAQALVGTMLPFSVTVEGLPPFTYQWYQDGVPVGADTNTYTAIVLNGSHTYNCVITNAYGFTNSSTATIQGVEVTGSGTNSATNITTFAVNFMDTDNGAYTPNNGANNDWVNILYQGLGVYPDDAANTNWNGFGIFPNGYLPTFDSTTSPQVLADGTLTSITLNLDYGFDSSSGLYYGPETPGGNTGQGEPSLILGACAVVNSGNPGVGSSTTPLGSITLSNVPPGVYTLYLYSGAPNNDRGATFNFSGGALYGTNAAMNDCTAAPATSFVYGVTYVVYTNVMPSANGTISGTWGAISNSISGNTGEGDFSGLQLVRVSGPPAGSVPPVLTINLSGASAVISWSPTNGVLQSATSLTGTFNTIGGSTSPYTNTLSGTQQFFRVWTGQ